MILILGVVLQHLLRLKKNNPRKLAQQNLGFAFRKTFNEHRGRLELTVDISNGMQLLKS